ncbi:MAG: RDD family protein [Pseudomonadota bacterium]
MSVVMSDTHLPDPITQAEFYAGVPIKRLLAWVVDIIVIAIITAVAATLPFFIGWFFFPLIFMVLSFIYRVVTIGAHSATWGMRLFNIELRNRQGQHLDGAEALLHTAGYMVASAFFIPQLISLILMGISERGQGLHDLICGTTAINKPQRH